MSGPRRCSWKDAWGHRCTEEAGHRLIGHLPSLYSEEGEKRYGVVWTKDAHVTPLRERRSDVPTVQEDEYADRERAAEVEARRGKT
jgi:hypothetical protein